MATSVLLCVCVQAVIALMEMGFDEKEVIDALRVNNNQQDAAVRKHSEGHKIMYMELPKLPIKTKCSAQ